MFDVGFWELVLIFGVGLMILGPERMPRVAAQIGRWVGRARRTASQLHRQLRQELELEEFRNRPRPSPPPSPAPPSGATPDREENEASRGNRAGPVPQSERTGEPGGEAPVEDEDEENRILPREESSEGSGRAGETAERQ